MKLNKIVPTAVLTLLAAGVAVAQQPAAGGAVEPQTTPRTQSQTPATRSTTQQQTPATRSQAAQSTTTESHANSKAHPDFATADSDKDGLLSIMELKAALPDVTITDANADGFVNQSEAETGIDGLAFESGGFTGGSSLVSEPEYGLMLSTLSGDAAAAMPGRSGAAPRSPAAGEPPRGGAAGTPPRSPAAGGAGAAGGDDRGAGAGTDRN